MHNIKNILEKIQLRAIRYNNDLSTNTLSNDDVTPCTALVLQLRCCGLITTHWHHVSG